MSHFRTALAGIWMAALMIECEPAKAPSCQTDSDCTASVGAGYCVQSICVECRTDDNCKLPKMCGQSHTCFAP